MKNGIGRIWDSKKKKYINPDKVRINPLNGNIHGCLSDGNVLEWELEPFSGLVSGKEKLFCGDVIGSFDSEGNEIKHIIAYDDFEARFVAQFVPYNEFNHHCGINQKWIDEFSKKKIGNIHEK